MGSGMEICGVKSNIAYRIRKLRESKDYSQENMAGELGISTSAYSKIERGVTDPSVGRVAEIAKILEVDMTYFFHDQATQKLEELNNPYGYVNKTEIEDLRAIIRKMQKEIDSLKAVFQNPVSTKKKKA